LWLLHFFYFFFPPPLKLFLGFFLWRWHEKKQFITGRRRGKKEKKQEKKILLEGKKKMLKGKPANQSSVRYNELTALGMLCGRSVMISSDSTEGHERRICFGVEDLNMENIQQLIDYCKQHNVTLTFPSAEMNLVWNAFLENGGTNDSKRSYNISDHPAAGKEWMIAGVCLVLACVLYYLVFYKMGEFDKYVPPKQ
jgi:hypothetical protein